MESNRIFNVLLIVLLASIYMCCVVIAFCECCSGVVRTLSVPLGLLCFFIAYLRMDQVLT